MANKIIFMVKKMKKYIVRHNCVLKFEHKYNQVNLWLFFLSVLFTGN